MKKISALTLITLALSVVLSVTGFAQTQTLQDDNTITDENGGIYTIISEEIQELNTRVKGDTLYYELTARFWSDTGATPSTSYPNNPVTLVHNGEIYTGNLTLKSATWNIIRQEYVCIYGGTLISTGMLA